MIQKQYEIIGPDKILYSVQEFDANGNLLLYKDKEVQHHDEVRYDYIYGDLLKTEIKFFEGKESSRLEYSYNNEGDLTEVLTFISGNLWERIEYGDENGREYIKIFQEEKLVEETRFNNDDFGYEKKIWENGRLIYQETSTYDNDLTTETIVIKDEQGLITETQINLYNSEGQKEKSVVNNKEVRDWTVTSVFNNDMLVKESSELPLNPSENRYLTNDYDNHGNIIRSELRDATGKLLNFFRREYNEDGYILEEVGYENGSFNAISGELTNAENYHYIYEYEN